MACARQCVIARRQMQQCIEAIVDDTQKCHDSRASALVVKETRRKASIVIVTVSEWN